MINYFTWYDFDKSVEQIAIKCKFKEFSGIYGVPRGGLCLAVSLSHKLNIELISEPLKNSLIVDDVYETGLTLTTFKDCLLYTSPSPRDRQKSRMPSSA